MATFSLLTSLEFYFYKQRKTLDKVPFCTIELILERKSQMRTNKEIARRGKVVQNTDEPVLRFEDRTTSGQRIDHRLHQRCVRSI